MVLAEHPDAPPAPSATRAAGTPPAHEGPGQARGLRAALLAALAAACMASLPALAQPAVPTLVVGTGAGPAGFEIEGTLEAQQQSVLSAQVPGRILSFSAKAGDRVKAGQLLARIDERELAAGLAAGDAGVAQAQAALTQARQQFERTRSLRAQGFVAEAALDDARAQLDAAQAALGAAQAGRQQALVARGHAAVTAPFDGVVLATHAEAGELAAPGRALLTVYAPGRLRARVLLPLSQAAAARAASAVEVQLPDGRRVAPARRTVLPGADATSQTIEWRLDLAAELAGADAGAAPGSPAAPAPMLLPGQPVRVSVAGAPRTAPGAAAPAGGPLTIPAAALLRRGELVAVYAEQGGRFVLKAVRVGPAVGGQVPVLAGLKAGERIAADAVKAGLAGATPAR